MMRVTIVTPTARSNRTETHRAIVRRPLAVALACIALTAAAACSKASEGPQQRTFNTPEDAVRALTDAAKAGKLDDLRAIFGPDVQQLIDSSDAATARRNQQVFAVAVAERWRLVDDSKGKTLVVGNEDWPFPVPLVKDAKGWRFDTAAGTEEVLSRRIGRNELAAIRICGTYVTAQRLYHHSEHDGKPAGLYARTFRSDPGKENGLYWPAPKGGKRSPLGDLVAQAAEEGRTGAGSGQPSPFHGYYFKILTAQGAAAPGGARDYLVNGDLSGGFALVAWPAQYDATGIMSFIVGQDGVVREKDLGRDTDKAAKAMTAFNPDDSWQVVQ
jgi:hypothetical protein